MAANAGHAGPTPPRVGDPLVGRDALIEELLALAETARHGTGSMVLLVGEAGIGKTSVVRRVADHVRNDLVVSWGNCVAGRSAPPFWPWRDLVAIEPAPHDPADPTIGAPRFEHLNELREQVVARAHRAPAMHVIEDLQWADVASVLLLTHLTAIADAPLLIVATLRTGEPIAADLDAALGEVRRASPVRELAPLGDAEIRVLLHDFAIEPDDSLVQRVMARTGGNPLFVTELLRVVPLTDDAPRRVRALSESLPGRVADLIAHRVARLPAAVADALAAAAAAGSDGDSHVLARVLGVPVGPTAELLDQARAAHLVDISPTGRWQFPHELIRDAIYERVGSPARARYHAKVLEVLAEDASTPPPLLAHHALAAQPIVDPERVVALAARAGESAFAQHAYEEAVTWFTHALLAAPPGTAPRWRAELLVLCGEAHRHTGNLGPARRAFLDARVLTDDPALLARAALGFADPGADLGIAYRTDDPMTASILDAAIAVQPAGDSLTTVFLEARLAAELHFSDDPSRARALAAAAMDRALRLGDPRALTLAGAVTHDAFVVGQARLDEQLAKSEQLLVWARAAGSAAARLTAHRARVFDLLAAADLAGMDEEIVNFRRLAEPLRVPAYQWWPALWSAMRAMLEGRYKDAEERAVVAFELGRTPFPPLAFLNLSFLLFFLRREQGRLAEMEQATRDYAASHADIPALRVGLAFLLAELGRADEAGGMLAAFDDNALDRLRDRNWPASWFQLARVAYLVGDRSAAARLIAPSRRPTERCITVSLATVCLGASDLAEAWLHHTVGELDDADTAYTSAEQINARLGARAWLAQTRADHSTMLRARGRGDDVEVADRLRHLAVDEARRIGLATVDVQPSSQSPERTTEFRRDGAVWELAFAHRSARLGDSRGLHDLAYLLSRPGVAVSVLELAGDGQARPDRRRGDEVFDERARRAIRDRLRALDDEEADAESAGNGERAAIARSQRQELAEAVARDFGLGGRSRRLGDTVERARKTVSTRIRRAISAVGHVHPELGRHLERSIDTGAWCAYRPAEPVDWTT